MATYETTLIVPASLEDTFDFVSNFHNAALWDPRTYAAKKLTDGAVRVGTKFMLKGGMLRGDTFPARNRLARAILGMPLLYEVVTCESPRELELEGETPVLRYRDRIALSPAGRNTRLHYAARLELKGALAVGEVFLRMMFRRIGDDATRDIPAKVVEYVAAKAKKRAA